MSDSSNTPPPPASQPPPPEQPSGRDAKAQAKADKAYAKAQRPWYKKKRIMIPLVIVVLAIAGAAGSSTDDSGDPVASDNDSTAEPDTADTTAAEDGGDEEAPETTGIGSEARDGKFAFTVNGIECGSDSVGQDFMQEDAQGKYCLLDVRVENIGDEAQFLFADNQYLYDADGREFSADSMATIAANGDGSGVFADEINPGNSVEGVIVFDVPEGAEIVRAELHDSALSGGVEVDLSS